MLFNSWIFAFFFAIFIPLFVLVRNDVAKRNALLLVASYIFYGWWDSRFLILVAISTGVDFCAALGAAGKPVPWRDRMKSLGFLAGTTLAALPFARSGSVWILPAMTAYLVVLAGLMALIEGAPQGRRRVLWLCLSLVTNLGILVFFKYTNFLVDSFKSLFTLLGMKLDFFTLRIILPVGLSFYTFQAISRTIDSYRGRFDPQRSLLNYAAYHAFFPQLVAGPIERAGHLMPQFERRQPVDRAMALSGALLFMWGLYKKVVVADNLAPISDAVFAHGPAGHSAGEIACAILAFTFVIYCDFSGYSDMARGIARTFGFDLMINFNFPYFSRTPSEFWRRWHISLSSWLRDYLYIPLGGNRGSEFRVALNLMLTMILGGLWHGAAWTFVFWGIFHGAIQVIYKALDLDETLARTSPATAPGLVLHVTAWAVMTVLIMIGWVFFRAPTLAGALAVLGGVFGTQGYSLAQFQPLLFYILPLLAVEFYQRFSNHVEFMASGPFLGRYTAAMTVFFAILVLGAKGGQQFIYFDF